MQRHRIIAQIVILILSIINFALAAPISSERGIREVRTSVVDVAEDVITVSRKRWLPSDEWSTNAADRTNAPQGLAPSGSEESLEPLEGPPPPDSPTVYSSVWSNDFDDFRPLPVDLPPPAHHDNNMPLTLEMYLNQLHDYPDLTLGLGLPGPGSPPPAHDDLPLNPPPGSPQPSPGPADQDNTRPLRVGSPPPANEDMPVTLEMFLNRIDALFHLGLGMTDSISPRPPAAHDNLPFTTDLNTPTGLPQLIPGPTDQEGSHPLPVGPPPPAHNKLPLDFDLNVAPQPSQEPIDDQPPPAPPSDPESSKRPYSQLDPGPSRRPFLPSDPGPSSWEYPPLDLGLSIWAHPASNPEPSSSALPPPDPGPSTWAPHPPDLVPKPDPDPPPDQVQGLSTTPHPSTWALPPLDPGPSTWAPPPPDLVPKPDPDPPPDQAQGPSTTPHPSTWAPPPPDLMPKPDPDPFPDQAQEPSTPHPPSSPAGPQQHESDLIFFSDLFKSSRFKRRISRSPSESANAERAARDT